MHTSDKIRIQNIRMQPIAPAYLGRLCEKLSTFAVKYADAVVHVVNEGTDNVEYPTLDITEEYCLMNQGE